MAEKLDSGSLPMIFVGIAATVFILIFIGTLSGSIFETSDRLMVAQQLALVGTNYNVTFTNNVETGIFANTGNDTNGTATTFQINNIINGTLRLYNGSEAFNYTMPNASTYMPDHNNGSIKCLGSAAFCKGNSVRANFSYKNMTSYTVMRDAQYNGFVSFGTLAQYFPLLVLAVLLIVALAAFLVPMGFGRSGSGGGGGAL